MPVVQNEIIPFVSNLFKRLNYSPTRKELALMKDLEVKEIRLFFEAASTGMKDPILFEKFMYFLRLRSRGEAEKFDINMAVPESEKRTLTDNPDVTAPAPPEPEPPAPPEPEPPAPPEPEPPKDIAMLGAKPRELNIGGTMVYLDPNSSGYEIRAKNSSDTKYMETRLDFKGSKNLKLVSVGDAEVVDEQILEATLAPGADKVIGQLVPISMTESTDLTVQGDTKPRLETVPEKQKKCCTIM